MTLSDLAGSPIQLCETCLNLVIRKLLHISYRICSHANRKVFVTYNFYLHVENEGLLKVTGSGINCKNANVVNTAGQRRCYY